MHKFKLIINEHKKKEQYTGKVAFILQLLCKCVLVYDKDHMSLSTQEATFLMAILWDTD